MKQIPAPLYKKIHITVLTGSAYMLFGLAYYIAVRDSVLLLLSAALLFNCVWRAFSIYRISVKEAYEIVEGICVGVSLGLIGKLKTIHMMDNTGTETTIRLAKNCKFKIGDRYRLYFDNKNQFRIGNNFIDTVFSTGNFLGYEAAPEITTPIENNLKNI